MDEKYTVAKRKIHKAIYRLYLKGHVVGYAKQKGKAFLFSEDGEEGFEERIRYDDAVKLVKLPGQETGGVVASGEDITKIYKVNFRVKRNDEH